VTTFCPLNPDPGRERFYGQYISDYPLITQSPVHIIHCVDRLHLRFEVVP